MLKKEEILNFLFDYYFGTLWFVKEELIKIRAASYDLNSSRVGHPFVSIRKKPVVGREKIPMLIGSSKKRSKDDFIVKDIFEKDSTTWFGSLLVPFEVIDFFAKKDVEKKESKKTSFIQKLIEKNSFKPKLNQEEMALLEKWIIKKGYNNE